jgi:serine/threonine-protein kinase RsbW
VGIPGLIETFQITLAPDLSLLQPLRHSLRAWLEEVGVAGPPLSDVVLATHEAAANAIEHAASFTPIEIRARLAATTVAVEIRDYGRWKDAESDNEERGRGLQLIENLVVAVKVETDEDGTTLRLLEKI